VAVDRINRDLHDNETSYDLTLVRLLVGAPSFGFWDALIYCGIELLKCCGGGSSSSHHQARGNTSLSRSPMGEVVGIDSLQGNDTRDGKRAKRYDLS